MFVRVKRKIAAKKHKKCKVIFYMCLLCLFAAIVFKMKEDLNESC